MMTFLPHRQAVGPNHARGKLAVALAVLVCTVVTPSARGFQTEEPCGLTEPYRTIEVASAESGVIAELDIKESQAVRRGQVLAKLDCDIHKALLAIAKQAMQSKGTLQSALAEVQLRKDRLKNFEAVFAKGHARQEEVTRARADLAVAEAQLLAVTEERQRKELEYDKAMLQIERRKVRAPIDGVVSEIYKEQGEYLAPNSPNLLRLVQLDPLLAVFSLPSSQAKQMDVGQNVRLRFASHDEAAYAKVDMIAATTDPESGTVLVKIRIDNPMGRYRSGERCWLQLERSGEQRVEGEDKRVESGVLSTEYRAAENGL